MGKAERNEALLDLMREEVALLWEAVGRLEDAVRTQREEVARLCRQAARMIAGGPHADKQRPDPAGETGERREEPCRR